MENSLFTVEESMNADRRNRVADEQQVEDAYKSLFEQNMNSYK